MVDYEAVHICWHWAHVQWFYYCCWSEWVFLILMHEYL